MCNLSLISLNLSALSFFFLIFNLMKLNRVEKTIMHIKKKRVKSFVPDHFRFRHEAPIFWLAIALSWPLALYCLWRRQLYCRVIFSLATGSTVGEKGEKRGQTGKISANEASSVVAWGGGKGGTLSRPPQSTSRLSSLADFFSFFPQCEAWSQATSSFIF